MAARATVSAGPSAGRREEPEGWQITGCGQLGAVPPGPEKLVRFNVTPPVDAAPNTRIRLVARLDTTDRASGVSSCAVRLVPAVHGSEGDGEYTGRELDLSSLWEGTPASADDISGTAKVHR